MSFVRGALTLALVANVGCASHAKKIAKAAAAGVKTQLAQINPANAQLLGDHFARGLVAGTLAELGSEENLRFVRAVVDTTSSEAARSMLLALTSDGGRWQLLFQDTMDGAIVGLGQRLAADTALRAQLASFTHELSASAVSGARDALADVFPQCAGAANRRSCIEDEVASMSRAAARGMMAGFVDTARWPMLGLAFFAGVVLALLIVIARAPRAPTPRAVARTRAPGHHRHRLA
jgi:hypothetical protein